VSDFSVISYFELLFVTIYFGKQTYNHPLNDHQTEKGPKNMILSVHIMEFD